MCHALRKATRTAIKQQTIGYQAHEKHETKCYGDSGKMAVLRKGVWQHLITGTCPDALDYT